MHGRIAHAHVALVSELADELLFGRTHEVVQALAVLDLQTVLVSSRVVGLVRQPELAECHRTPVRNPVPVSLWVSVAGAQPEVGCTERAAEILYYVVLLLVSRLSQATADVHTITHCVLEREQVRHQRKTPGKMYKNHKLKLHIICLYMYSFKKDYKTAIGLYNSTPGALVCFSNTFT